MKYKLLLLLRSFIILFFILIQLLFIIGIIQVFADKWYYVNILFSVLSACTILYIIAKDENPMFKMSWIILISLLPVFGGLLYLATRVNRYLFKYLRHLDEVTIYRKNIFKSRSVFGSDYKVLTYLENDHWPAYQNTKSQFLESGEIKFKTLLEELKKAEHFIFMEYFIITKSKMWNEILSILIEKAKSGVEIKLLYDDFGSAMLPFRYHKRLQSYGINAVKFNPIKLQIDYSMNYRDHRKIVVIDNKVAFTGGINIGDEYINRKKRFGHWHDAAIMITGEAVASFTMLFIEMWTLATKKQLNFKTYNLSYDSEPSSSVYVPFGDIPLKRRTNARDVLLHLINQAKDSIYITTPYLILDNEISTALKLAAQSGVSVSIIIPSIPDKKLVYIVSESYVSELTSFGVNIYKYDPGFIHSKLILIDHQQAMIGTSNLDFRSLYLHFENNVWLNDPSTLDEIQAYFTLTLLQSTLITKESMNRKGILYRILQIVLKGFATIL